MTDQTVSLNLKPCPLCHSVEVGYSPPTGDYYGHVSCAEFGISLNNNITGWERNKNIAVERWNRREK